ncbi:MAG: bestrophin family protein [Bacteroidia bacterium]
MVNYNPKEWFSFIFHLHKADTFRKLLPVMLLTAVYSGLVVYLELHVWDLHKEHELKNISVFHGLLGFALSMLLVFRTNTAYDRWWEGRRLWGSLVNNSRNLAMKLRSILGKDEENCLFFAQMIPNYAFVLKNHLRKVFIKEEFDETKDFGCAEITKGEHAPNQVALAIFKKVQTLHSQGKINDTHLLYLNSELQSFADICGACERIRNTPIPFSYSVFLKKFIFLYVITLPIGHAFTLKWFAVPMVVLVFYALASLELIAEEIENPFGSDANDLPTDSIAQGIRKTVKEIFQS